MLSPSLSRTIFLHPLLIPDLATFLFLSAAPAYNGSLQFTRRRPLGAMTPARRAVENRKIPGAARSRTGDVVRGSIGKTTRFHYNGGKPPGKVRSLAAGLSFRDERNWQELCRQVSTVKKRGWKPRGRARVT